MVKDPVCDMDVSEDTSKAKSGYQGQTYYFCSILYKQMFERETQKYIPPAESRERTASS